MLAALSLLTVSLCVPLSCAAPATDPETKSIWVVNIWRGPAPSPEEGPPASANALRDPSKLKYEAVGIACAYLVWIALTGVAIIVVGRRIRRRRRESDQSLHIRQMETIKPTQVTLREIHAGPKSPLSPKSPGKMASIKSWARGNKARQSEISVSTVNTRVDERVIENDRARNLDDMAKLYAAVMAHDEERAHKPTGSNESSPITDDHITPITPRSPQCPPEIAHPAYHPPPSEDYYQQQYQQYQNFYGPTEYQQYQNQHQAAPPYFPQEYPQHRKQPSHDSMAPPQPMPTDNDRESLLENPVSPRRNKPSAISIISSTASRLGSSQSNKARPSPITVRGQPISKPLGSADLRQSAYAGSQTSLQPSVYSPGPPPPTPGRGPVRPTEEIEMHGRPQLTFVNTSNNFSAKALPFRQFQDPLKSAPATKTTFIDRRVSAMNGPKTGVPKTPYSPYCPSTPMTPITPRRLLGKEELKKNKKQYALGVVRENDMVQSDNDMWGTD